MRTADAYAYSRCFGLGKYDVVGSSGGIAAYVISEYFMKIVSIGDTALSSQRILRFRWGPFLGWSEKDDEHFVGVSVSLEIAGWLSGFVF